MEVIQRSWTEQIDSLVVRILSDKNYKQNFDIRVMVGEPILTDCYRDNVFNEYIKFYTGLDLYDLDDLHIFADKYDVYLEIKGVYIEEKLKKALCEQSELQIHLSLYQNFTFIDCCPYIFNKRLSIRDDGNYEVCKKIGKCGDFEYIEYEDMPLQFTKDNTSVNFMIPKKDKLLEYWLQKELEKLEIKNSKKKGDIK